ncbi:MAG: hypothetical protein U0163_06020 [Gemmatimonadaceae bacterium]
MSDSKSPPTRRFVTTIVAVEGREETKVVELPERTPAPWTDNERLSIVGQPIPRVDAREKVTGRARYTADVARPAMLYAVVVRSPIPAGTLTALDVDATRRDASVADVIGPDDIPRIRVNGITLFDRNVVRRPADRRGMRGIPRRGSRRGRAAVGHDALRASRPRRDICGLHC